MVTSELEGPISEFHHNPMWIKPVVNPWLITTVAALVDAAQAARATGEVLDVESQERPT